MESIASSLLSLAYRIFQPGFCPGDWVWATSMAGLLIGLWPVAGAFVIAVVRKFTGNRYGGAPLIAIGAIAVVSVFVMPWLLASGVSSSYRDIFGGGTGGLTQTDVANMSREFCFVGTQTEYLGGGQNVYETLFYPSDSALAYGYYLAGLVGLPILTLLAIMLLGRVALRRGPKWPGRFIWGSYVAFVLLSAGVEANTAIHLWIGFLPAVILGVIPVAIIGPPSWSTIQNSDRPPEPRPQPRPEPRPEPEPAPPQRQYAPTAVAPSPPPVAAAAVPPAASTAGDGRFERIRRLGQGGFGTVWQARDTQLGRIVALKIAHVTDPDTEERMRREARALAMLSHPNCVRVYDLVEEHDGLALVMEYLEGRSLADMVDTGGALDDQAAGRLWATLAGALSAAHEKGVLHRDMKPSNVIVDPQGLPHLIDFGIARSKNDAKLTATGMMIGTPDYTAPETAEGKEATPASDAWQLAATVSFALSGHPPRGTRETPMAALMAAARAEPASHLPAQSVHARLLRASLDPQPRNRPTLAAVEREVQGWLSRIGSSADGPVTRIVPRSQ
ncbi:serine/threonine-protein kinase [Prauserella rugosa]|uniref:non-specific serine/threonine protein kinase n=1 Tax=Prauserella rugosa TaxID=43354 RepID=A0A660CB46_9PSEU|nr:serine/threonine-protein kinase [Prauserella rugosa]KMS85996.1 serine/threonine protein kinase [Streptomyces regensis]TWH20800.1 serine/threonine protein kinase [Prauserella rugosa]